MTGTKISYNRILIVLSLIAVLVLGNASFLYAADNASMPDLTKNSTNLTIVTQYTDEENITPISGMELTIYKVADVSVNGGKVNYTPTNEFKSAGIDYNNLTTGSSIDAAEKLSKLTEGGKITGKTKTSGGEGQVVYGAVDNGMYLVVQTGSKGNAKEYTKLRPYLIMAPQPLTDIGQNAWEYDVYSIPKMEVLNKVVKLTKKVNGVDNHVLQNPDDKFSYAITSDINYAPDQFAVVDNVPEELNVVDKRLIEIEVNGKKLDEETKNALLKIDGNTVRVEPTKEQINQWAPFEMKIMFYCQFKEDLVLTEDNDTVTNVAGYEVENEYIEPEGTENEARVKTEEAVPTTTAKDSKTMKTDTARTGDEFATYMRILVAVMILSAAVITVIAIRRRRANANEQD